MKFPGSHILSMAQFERADIEQVFAVADRMEPYAHRRRITNVLDGAILGSMVTEGQANRLGKALAPILG